MKKGLLAICVMLTLMLAPAPPALSLSYFVYDQWGGTWQDANKTAANTEDDLMCWAAAASNVLAWGKWGTPTYNTTDTIFKHFQDHWTDNVGRPVYGWVWWFNGAPSPSSTGSQVDVPGGGNFYPGTDFWGNYYGTMSSIIPRADLVMHYGYGVSLAIFKGAMGHAVTMWGFDYEKTKKATVYKGIYVTDSDDGALALKYYPLIYENNLWYLGGGYSGWYIGEFYSLKFQQNLGSVVPTPGSFGLFGGGFLLIKIIGTRKTKNFLRIISS